MCLCFPLWRLYMPVCVKPLPSRDALFKMLLWYLCLLKGLSFLLTPCRIGPPLAPLVGEGGTRVGPAGTGPHHLGKYHSRGRKGNDLDNLWVWRTFLRTERRFITPFFCPDITNFRHFSVLQDVEGYFTQQKNADLFACVHIMPTLKFYF